MKGVFETQTDEEQRKTRCSERFHSFSQRNEQDLAYICVCSFIFLMSLGDSVYGFVVIHLFVGMLYLHEQVTMAAIQPTMACTELYTKTSTTV